MQAKEFSWVNRAANLTLHIFTPHSDEIECNGDPALAFVLDFFPELGSFSPIKTLSFNWNPIGHGPADVYTVPHFDVNFYNLDKVAINNK